MLFRKANPVLPGIILGLAVCSGATIALQGPRAATLLAALATTVIALELFSTGVLAGLLIAASANAIPFVNLGTLVNLSGWTLSGSLTGTDLAFVGLFGMSLSKYLTQGIPTPQTRFQKLLPWWAAIFLGLWGIELIRALDAGGTLLQSASTGRDFLFFGITIPFVPALLRTRRELQDCVTFVGVATIIFGCIYIASVIHLIPTSLANAQLIREQGAVTRIYNTSYYLFELALSVSLAYLLVSKDRRRALAVTVAIVSGAAMLFSFTRALYLGGVLAILFGVGLWAISRASDLETLRTRIIRGTAAIVIGVALFAFLAPGVMSKGPLSSLATRLTSTSESLQTTELHTTSLGYRVNLSHLMTHTLGGDWPTGLGFLSPKNRYFVDLPAGSIRNSDLGVLNVLMTMGALGVVMLYALPLLLLGELTSSAHRRSEPHYLALGGIIWIFFTLFTSYTLGSYSSVSGMAILAVGLGVFSTWGVKGRSVQEALRRESTTGTRDAAWQAAGQKCR